MTETNRIGISNMPGPNYRGLTLGHSDYTKETFTNRAIAHTGIDHV